MFALILESLGSTELIFILAIALIFIGPRKLPQLARSAGKGLAEFRRASDDFKRTWEREVALEVAGEDDNSLLEAEKATYEPPHTIPSENSETELTTADPDLVVPREDVVQATSEEIPEAPEMPVEPAQPAPVTKQNWL